MDTNDVIRGGTENSNHSIESSSGFGDIDNALKSANGMKEKIKKAQIKHGENWKSIALEDDLQAFDHAIGANTEKIKNFLEQLQNSTYNNDKTSKTNNLNIDPGMVNKITELKSVLSGVQELGNIKLSNVDAAKTVLTTASQQIGALQVVSEMKAEKKKEKREKKKRKGFLRQRFDKVKAFFTRKKDKNNGKQMEMEERV